MWWISNFPCSLTSNITSQYSTKNLALHSFTSAGWGLGRSQKVSRRGRGKEKETHCPHSPKFLCSPQSSRGWTSKNRRGTLATQAIVPPIQPTCLVMFANVRSHCFTTVLNTYPAVRVVQPGVVQAAALVASSSWGVGVGFLHASVHSWGEGVVPEFEAALVAHAGARPRGPGAEGQSAPSLPMDWRKPQKQQKQQQRRQHELTKVLHEPATLRALTLLPVPSPPTPSFPLEWWIFVLLSIIIFITTTITPTRPPPPSLPPVLSTCRFFSTYDFHHHHSFPTPPSSPLLFYSSAELSHNLNNDFHHRRCKFSRRRPSEGGDGGGGCGGDENQQTLILQTSPRVSRTGLTSSPWPCESALSAAPAWPPAAPGATSLPWRPCAHPTWPSRVSSCLPRRSSDQSRSLRLRRYPFGARPGSWGCCRWPFLIAKSDQCQIFPTA